MAHRAVERPMVEKSSPKGQARAVLCSAGLDSAVLVAYEQRQGPVVPVYVAVGLAWEAAERRALERLLRHPAFRGVLAAEALELSMHDLYSPTHWAIRGVPPDYDTPDEDVCLVGRNVVLLSKAGVFCAMRRIPRMAIGPLAGNPFPDATPRFFDAMANALSIGLAHPIEVVAPFATLHKADVIARGIALGVPLELTLSCMNPQEDAHCGRCSKCRERHDAFLEAGIEDPTTYAATLPR
jgi:7-cyano-7-deazaguanine synthase